jgi:hypothetical protein
MKQSIIVFQVGHHHYGLDPVDFEAYFALKSVWISPPRQPSPWWRFERRREITKGFFVHFGALTGLSMAEFSGSGFVFLKNVPAVAALGICANGLIAKVPKHRLKKRVIAADEYRGLPEGLPCTAFSGVRWLGRKPILIIDPLLLFHAYDLFAQF